MNSRDLLKRTKWLALGCLRAGRALPKRIDCDVLARQFIRSATSVGANYREALRARSRAEFISKMSVSYSEAGETVYWLELVQESGMAESQEMSPLIQEARELTRIFAASLRTMRGKSADSFAARDEKF